MITRQPSVAEESAAYEAIGLNPDTVHVEPCEPLWQMQFAARLNGRKEPRLWNPRRQA